MAETPSGPRSGGSRSDGPRRRHSEQPRSDRPARQGPGARRRDDRRGRSQPSRNDSPGRADARRGGSRDGERRPRSDDSVTPAPAFPDIDPDVEPKQLDRIARRDLSALDKDDAEFVARHLVMSGKLVDDDPELAFSHAKAALFKGSRIPVVRETLGITAYLTGDFALSLRELRTHRRLSGSDANLPMMVDCERGLGRSDKALELAHSVDPATLDTAVRVELAIARSGARLDLGQPDRALLELQIPELDPDVAYSYSPALFDAYAVVLEDLGRSEEAAVWGRRATIAAEALAEASGDSTDDVIYIDHVDDPDGDNGQDSV